MISTGIYQWLFIVLGLSIWITYTSSKELRVVCYYTNWSVYRPGTAKFSPQNINPYLCTHLVYAFGGFTKENTLKPFDKYQDIEKGGYAKFTGLKTYNKNLKTLLAIGGWNEASSRFSPMVANADRRKQLVKNSIKFLRQNHFDGLDLDWEYPAFREGGKPRDKENYAKLVQELREEFDRESEKTGRPRLLLTMAVPAGIEYVNKGYDIPKLTKYLDWMNILSYDYHSAFEPAVNHHAPLYPLQEATEYDYDADLNIDFTIKHYLELGADPAKLVVGIPTYGRSYTLFNPDANAIGDPADGPGEMGEATRENGYLAYYEICENVKNNDWSVVQPNEMAMGPYAYKENQWVGFDDENIARKKAEYVAKNGLGGVMFWAIDNDDFRGNCHGRPYPLIEAAKEALISAYGLTDENLVAPPPKPTKPKNRRTRPKTTEEPDSGDESTKPSAPRRRNRIKPKANNRASETDDRSQNRRKEGKREDNTSTYSSLKVITPAYTTPEPPSTPDQGGGFKCEDEGFFPHPKDCKKYYWCLSGPGELGIVAHQFTCPAGLYFNKAADSCDYSQNVLCNKRLSKTTSTTEGKKNSESSQKSTTTTQRPTTRASTTRATTKATTTTEAVYDDEYEYEDEDANNPNSEEDPKVIKELLDLIKKAGGIEELEKQLNIANDDTKQGVTTPSTRTKSIVEKFLNSRNSNSRNSNSNKSEKNKYTSVNRNSRGPQNAGIKPNEETEESSKKSDKKPQYTTILRRRPSTPKADTQEENEEVNDEKQDDEEKSSSPRYTSIRRNKEASSTEHSANRVILDRNKILGEDKDTEDSNRREITVHTTPQYVNIRRQRPTTEKTSTSKYVSIRRSTTHETTKEEDDEESTTLKNQIQDESSTYQQRPSSTLRYQILNRHSTSPSSTSSTENNLSTDAVVTTRTETIKSEGISSTTAKIAEQSTSEVIRSSTSSESPSTTVNGTETEVLSTKLPALLEPRPFSIETIPTISTTQKPLRYSARPATSSTKVSDTIVRSRLRPKFNSNSLNDRANGINDNSVEFGLNEGVDSTSRPLRSRTRFTRPDVEANTQKSSANPSFRQRSRPTSTQRTYTDKEQDEIQRKYRPIGLDDLSSLTAADIEIQGSKKTNTVRRTRIRSTTTTTEASLKESSITPTRRRNLGASNANRNKIKKNELPDQIKSQTNEITITKKEEVKQQQEVNIKPPKRARKVLRRLRTSTSGPDTAANIVTSRGRPFSYSSLNLQKSRTSKLLLTEIDSNEANSSEDISEEDENIKLSATNIRENSNANNDNVIFNRRYGRIDKSDAVYEKSQYGTRSQSTTLPTISRTRKIIRKLRPTVPSAQPFETTTHESDLQNSLKDSYSKPGRTRKVIRRLRPNSKITFSKENLNEDDSRELFVNKAQVPQFYEKKPSQDIRGREKTSNNNFRFQNNPENKPTRGFYSRFRTTTDYEDSRESVTELTSRGSLRYVDIVRTTEHQGSTEKLFRENDDFTTSFTTQDTTINDLIDPARRASSNFLTSDDGLSFSRQSDFNELITTDIPNVTSESFQSQFNNEGNRIGVTISISNNSDDQGVTTVSSFQESSSTNPISETVSSLEDMETTTFVTNIEDRVTDSDRIEETTGIPSISSSEATTEYIRRSTLRNSRLRPTYHIRRTTTTTRTDNNSEFRKLDEHQRVFSRRRPTFRQKYTTQKPSSTESISEKPRRRYPFGKNGRTTAKPSVNSEELRNDFDSAENTERPTTKPRLKYFSNNNRELKPTEPYKIEETTTERAETSQSTTEESLGSVSTKSGALEKQRSRNKALFSKKRKMNIPGFITAEPKEEPTTEHLTTLYHVFAEPEINDNQSNLITKNETHINTRGKIERVVEINRIVEVHVKNGDNNESRNNGETTGILDKIGAINRVTSIKVVDENGTNITNPQLDQTNQRLLVVHDIIEQEKRNGNEGDQRQDRKFEIKLSNKPSKNDVQGAEIIDGKSHIKVITPRPLLITEASTIALEGLFSTTENSKSADEIAGTTVTENELLDTDYSRFVNIRVLKPGDGRSLGGDTIPGETPRVVRLIPSDEDVTMEAKVVEVTPKNINQTIRIAPIQVSMARSIADKPIVGLKKLNEKIGNTPFRVAIDSGVP